jgi:hypothetical protein
MIDPMYPSTKNLSGKWNRSAAFKPETIAALIVITRTAVESAIQNFKQAVDFASLTPEQQLEAGELLANGVTTELAAYVEKLKTEYGSALQGRN